MKPRGILRLLAAASVLFLFAGPAATQEGGRVGTILVGHGGGPAWDAQVIRIAELAQTGGPVEVSFLMGSGAPEHRFQDAARRLVAKGATRIVVVPLLVSSHGRHHDQIRYLAGATNEIDDSMLHHLHMAGIERADVEVPITMARAVDDSPEVADILAERARALATDPSAQAVFLIGHGPNDAEAHAEWMRDLRAVAGRVKETGGFSSVQVGLLRDDAPALVRAEAVLAIREAIELQHRATGRPVVVVPVLISTGSVAREKIPADLAGLPVAYDGQALLPHPGMAAWVESRVRNP